MENRDVFLTSGGESFNYIPALNAEPFHIDALAKIILNHIQGWPESVPSKENSEDREKIKQRAMQLGAKQ